MWLGVKKGQCVELGIQMVGATLLLMLVGIVRVCVKCHPLLVGLIRGAFFLLLFVERGLAQEVKRLEIALKGRYSHMVMVENRECKTGLIMGGKDQVQFVLWRHPCRRWARSTDQCEEMLR